MTATTPHWTPGTLITWRWGDVSGPHFAEPVRVVRDDDEVLAVWCAAGTPVLRKARADGLGIREDKATLFTAETVQATATWTGYDVLRVWPAGRRWAVWCFFDARTRAFEGWYVNLEDGHTRHDTWLHAHDRVLDVWVEPDRTHERKDEDELELAVAQGRYTRAEADAITAVADEVEAVVAAWGSPFCDGWESFEPDPAWPVPSQAPAPTP
ncbi:DUF402 domain-containing protein [Nocardioides rubriscoriae]|uniref:DUF402 domain-containing protein n=1 Tax=Nocardioides rubriscoriae TaxID=642762 RepID=UPI0014784128|nr:DUF402 domain-containing protein [Nocardioides rubriscoriae]